MSGIEAQPNKIYLETYTNEALDKYIELWAIYERENIEDTEKFLNELSVIWPSYFSESNLFSKEEIGIFRGKEFGPKIPPLHLHDDKSKYVNALNKLVPLLKDISDYNRHIIYMLYIDKISNRELAEKIESLSNKTYNQAINDIYRCVFKVRQHVKRALKLSR